MSIKEQMTAQERSHSLTLGHICRGGEDVHMVHRVQQGDVHKHSGYCDTIAQAITAAVEAEREAIISAGRGLLAEMTRIHGYEKNELALWEKIEAIIRARKEGS